MKVRFVFIAEGSSDYGLISHLETLCIGAGAHEAAGVPIDSNRLPESVGKRTADRIAAAIKLEPEANLFFIHRDADSRDPEPRYAEITSSVFESGLTQAWVGVVPVQEIEAWLLLDAQEILKVAGKPNGNASRLQLPAVHEIEKTANPKERLQAAILLASETTGRRRSQVSRDFSVNRRSLLERLTTDGQIVNMHAWCRMRDDLHRAIEVLVSATIRVEVTSDSVDLMLPERVDVLDVPSFDESET